MSLWLIDLHQEKCNWGALEASPSAPNLCFGNAFAESKKIREIAKKLFLVHFFQRFHFTKFSKKPTIVILSYNIELSTFSRAHHFKACNHNLWLARRNTQKRHKTIATLFVIVRPGKLGRTSKLMDYFSTPSFFENTRRVLLTNFFWYGDSMVHWNFCTRMMVSAEFELFCQFPL